MTPPTTRPPSLMRVLSDWWLTRTTKPSGLLLPSTGAPELVDVGDLLNPETGRAVAQALAADAKWRLRKVESLRLMEGRLGRRHCSIDMVPPPDWALAYDAKDRAKHSFHAVDGRIMVPIAQLEKGPVRDFDLRLPDGTPCALLTREQNEKLAIAAIAFELGGLDAFNNVDLIDKVSEIVTCDDSENAEALAQELIAEQHPSREGESLLTDLARHFLVMALLPKDLVGQRVVVKYAHHWEGDVRPWRDLRKILVAAAGYGAFRLPVEMSGPSDAGSYHLEVHLPTGLLAEGLRLPPPEGEGSTLGGITQDAQTGPIAHAVASYRTPPRSNQAKLCLCVPGRGMRAMAILVTLFTFAVFLLDRVLPNAHPTLLEAGDGSAALLLAVPAVALALLARHGENHVLASLLAPLRVTILICSILLVSGGWSIVGQLSPLWTDRLWQTGTVVSGLLFSWLSLGQFVSLVRHTRSRAKEE